MTADDIDRDLAALDAIPYAPLREQARRALAARLAAAIAADRERAYDAESAYRALCDEVLRGGTLDVRRAQHAIGKARRGAVSACAAEASMVARGEEMGSDARDAALRIHHSILAMLASDS